MLKKNKIVAGMIVLISVFGFALIRLYENQLFSDPFLAYFKSDYQNLPIPEIDFSTYFLNSFLRYFMNSILSLVVIAALFQDKKIVKFSSVLLTIFFFIIFSLLFLLLTLDENPSKMTLFYLRRFLIQPLFLLLFIPGFYFHKKTAQSL
uniref:exosortase F system-associated membrane protein n=1 Tax=Flavobacterium sp. TaxID=239 RepID=UPI004049DE16